METEVLMIRDKGQVIYNKEDKTYNTYGYIGENTFNSYNEVLSYLQEFNIHLDDIFFNFNFKK